MVTMDDVIKQLDREEPIYEEAAQLGADALPHLVALIQGNDPTLAAKATSLAGVIDAPESAAALEVASQHAIPAVRVAAAASARNLTSIPRSLAVKLLEDPDAGVRAWTLKAIEFHRPIGLRVMVEELRQRDPDLGVREQASRIVDQLP
jgi:HEAT repeat protein